MTADLSNALGMYQSAIDKLNSTDLEYCNGSFDRHKTGYLVCSKDCIPSKYEACNLGEELLECNNNSPYWVYGPLALYIVTLAY